MDGNEKWKQIKALDLSMVKKRLGSRKGWWWNLCTDKNRLEAEYRQFLYLIATNPGETVVPWSQKLDDFWHEHILDTRKYQADCEAIFGQIIHHNPHLPHGSASQKKAFNKTKEMYREAFGNKASGDSSNDVGCGGIFPIVFCGSSCGGDHGGSDSSCGSSCSSCSSCSGCSSCGGD